MITGDGRAFRQELTDFGDTVIGRIALRANEEARRGLEGQRRGSLESTKLQLAVRSHFPVAICWV
jgi:hypothetical protein